MNRFQKNVFVLTPQVHADQELQEVQREENAQSQGADALNEEEDVQQQEIEENALAYALETSPEDENVVEHGLPSPGPDERVPPAQDVQDGPEEGNNLRGDGTQGIHPLASGQGQEGEAGPHQGGQSQQANRHRRL